MNPELNFVIEATKIGGVVVFVIGVMLVIWLKTQQTMAAQNTAMVEMLRETAQRNYELLKEILENNKLVAGVVVESKAKIEYNLSCFSDVFTRLREIESNVAEIKTLMVTNQYCPMVRKKGNDV